MVELLLAVVPVGSWLETWLWCLSSLGNAAPIVLGMVFCWISGCHVPPELLSTGCITPGESVPSTFSIDAGLFELQAVKIAIPQGAIKTIFSFILPLTLNLFHLIWH